MSATAKPDRTAAADLARRRQRLARHEERARQEAARLARRPGLPLHRVVAGMTGATA